MQEVKLENKTLRHIFADYERVKRAFGPWETETVMRPSANSIAELRQVQLELIGNGLLPFALSNDLTDAEKRV